MIFLIVEDQDQKVEKIKRAIQEAVGAKVIEIYVTQNVASTIEFLSGQRQVDLLVLDLNLPVRYGEDPKLWSGLNVIKELNRRHDLSRPRSILGMTAADPISPEATRFFQNEGWALISYNAGSGDWEETIANKIHYLSSPIGQITLRKRKILYVGASPKDQDTIGVGTEQRRIEDVIRMGSYRDDFLMFGKQGSTFEQLSRELMINEPEFLHFSGHGDDSGLAMEDINGMTCYVPLEALETLLTNHESVKCVILNSCYSSEQAQALSANGIYVLGSTNSLPSNVAEEFAVGFYQAIVERKDILQAHINGQAYAKIVRDPSEDVEMELWLNGIKL